MIYLENVCKSYVTHRARKVVLDGVVARFEAGSNYGILGVNGAGKSTLLRLLAGSELPDRGFVRRKGRVSFPLAFDGTIHPNLTGRQNVAFVARIYGTPVKQVIDFVGDFSELNDFYDMPTKTYSSGMRAKLAFGLCLAIEFDFYLIDEITAVGDARFQAKCRDAFQSRLKNYNIIIVSHSFDTIKSYCNAGAVLNNGRLSCMNLDQAIGEYKQLIGIN